MTKLDAVQFAQLVPVFGTGLLLQEFRTDCGWRIYTDERGVVLYRPAMPEQNVREVKPFRVVGAVYSEPVSEHEQMQAWGKEVDHVAEQESVSRDGSCADAAAASEQRPDAGGASEAPKQAQGGPKKARARKVTT